MVLVHRDGALADRVYSRSVLWQQTSQLRLQLPVRLHGLPDVMSENSLIASIVWVIDNSEYRRLDGSVSGPAAQLGDQSARGAESRVPGGDFGTI